MNNTASTQTVVKFGDTFYLKNKSGQYLIAADRGRYFFPQLDRKGHQRLQLTNKTGELHYNDEIKIRSLETQLGDRDILGAFPDSHNCYYWNDGYDNRKQSWKITKASGKPGKIRYGDEVYLTNVYYDNQTLATDPKNPSYLTTVKNAKEVWILESTETTPVTESSTPKSVNIFDLSVASGDPTPTGVVLWTRINPESEAYRDSIPLEYQVSLSRNFDDPLIKGTVEASDISKETDYTVKVNLDKLEPNQRYFYRFTYGTATSPIGRCKTLPAENEQLEKLRLAVITCNDYSTGYFNAFYHLAEEDIDFVVHLGDFVYEYPQYPPGYGDIFRTDLKLTDNKFPISDPDVNAERTILLKDFRHVYRTYRRDPALQKAMENHTWIITLDDHEIADNCYWDYANNTMDISVDEPKHPIYQKFAKGSDEAKQAMKQLYESATQAWSEYIPTSFQKTGEPPYKLYRYFRFGSLIDFFLTDSRSFRDKPDLEINKQILAEVKQYQESNPNDSISEAMTHARKIVEETRSDWDEGDAEWKASMLGKKQKEWLINGVTNSNAAWKVWGNQTLLATALANELKGEIDDWHGFKAERYEILQAIKDSETAKQGTDKTSRFVVLTGDMHTSLIAYLKTEFSGDTPTSLEDIGDILSSPIDSAITGIGGIKNKVNWDYSKLAGVEFMTPSLTSPGISDGIYAKIADKTGSESLAPVTETVEAAASWVLGGASSLLSSVVPDIVKDAVETVEDKVSLHKTVTGNIIKRLSPHIEHFDSSINGYAIAEFTKDKMQWYVYAIDKTVYDKVEDGRNLSTPRAEKKLVQSATYNPNGIQLDD